MTLNAAETLARLRHHQTLPATPHLALVPPTGVALASVDINQDDAGDHSGFEVEPAVFAALADLPALAGQRAHTQNPNERAVDVAAAVAVLETLA